MSAHTAARPSRAFRRHLDRLTREADDRLALMRRQAAGMKGRRLVRADLVGMREALLDPALGGAALEALAAAYGAAHGVGTGLACECFVCTARWAPERVPVAAVVITTTKPDAVLMAMVCERCAAVPRPRLEAEVAAAVKRDFLGDGGEVLPVSALAPGGAA